MRKTDGSKPTVGALAEIARTFKDIKKKRGRRVGDKATTKEEDKVILKTFHKMRPPGYGVDSRVVHNALPAPIRSTFGFGSLGKL